MRQKENAAARQRRFGHLEGILINQIRAYIPDAQIHRSVSAGTNKRMAMAERATARMVPALRPAPSSGLSTVGDIPNRSEIGDVTLDGVGGTFERDPTLGQ